MSIDKLLRKNIKKKNMTLTNTWRHRTPFWIRLLGKIVMLILFELGEEGYSKPIKTSNTYSRNYIVYESNGIN